MPELPEVETTRLGLIEILKPPQKINSAKRRRKDLRYAIPASLERDLKNSRLLRIERRAKFLFFHFRSGVMVSHLGMTGSWRLAKPADLEKHDHFYLEISKGKLLVYRDPRRFGFIEWASSVDEYWSEKKYGPEPLSEDFSVEYLWQKSRGKSVAIKTFLMDQRVVVGIGNIYASETLFRSGVRPQKKTSSVSKKSMELIVQNSREVLQEALAAGGSTISDFKKATGDSGYFQHSFDVYGREGQECNVCGTLVKSVVITGRSSFYCPKCQS